MHTHRSWIPASLALLASLLLNNPLQAGQSRQYNDAVLLITAESLAGAWQPFADWKTANGKRTRILTIAEIDALYAADNLQEKIRLCVRDHIDNRQTRWIILGGDSLPGGKGLVPGGHTTRHAKEPQGIPTDIVYLSPTNWDADGDGIYGEFGDDKAAITYPDGTVGLGRIPVRTAADVAAFTDKVIAYEANYPTDGFAKQIIYTNTDRPAYAKVRKSWDSHLSKVWDGEMGRFFAHETPWDKEGQPGSYQLSPSNMVKLLNDRQTGKLHIHGHGHLPVWILENQQNFTEQHVGQLQNDGAYPLITTVSCNTGEYDSSKDPSIVEQMLRQPKAGSVAIVAPVRTGKPHFANPARDFPLMMREGKLDGTTMTMTRYWTVGMEQGVTTGEALMKAKAMMAEDGKNAAAYHLCLCEINLLGDPTLDMRAQNPHQPQLTTPASIATGRQVIQIATDAPGSTVCAWKGDEVYVTATTDADGKAELVVEPATAGKMSVSVSGASLNSVVREVPVTAK